ncbi:MAG: winged helix DNA-binding domain-containing protein [Nitriliruptoraceae bacterium]
MPQPKAPPGCRNRNDSSVAPTVTLAARRTRLIQRHHLDGSAPDATSAIHSVLGMHSSDPTTPHLGVLARMAASQPAVISERGFDPLDEALHFSRDLWRLHAMRRTLFIITTDDGPTVHGAASMNIAAQERRRLHRWLADSQDPRIPADIVADVSRRTIEKLATDGPMSSQQLSQSVPELAQRITVGSGKWKAEQSLASRLLLVMALEGGITRTEPLGSWRSSQYRWASIDHWFSDPPTRASPSRTAEDNDDVAAAQGRARLVARYLESCGPATKADIAWWTGWSATKVTNALTAIEAAAVTLADTGDIAFVTADDDIIAGADDDHVGNSNSGTAVTFLPSLDSTPMSYRDRSWYLGEHQAALFDRNGNIGPTIWVNGRIIGGWAQSDDGVVVTHLLDKVDATAQRLIAQRADELTSGLNGGVVVPRFRTPLERHLAAGKQ